MKRKIGINGFGRMGRLVFRVLEGHPDLEVVHVNEIKGGCACAAHLLEFDSVHGRWGDAITSGTDHFSVDGRRVVFSDVAKPEDVPWAASGVEMVLECTGKFRTLETLSGYFAVGIQKVIVAAPVKEGALNLVMGCNHTAYHPATDHLVTAASCTTNCIAPVVKVIHETFGIEQGTLTTIHDVTNTQVMVDAPHADLRRARAALSSLIPTSTGSATAITMIYPELKGKLNGLAVRVPLLNASLTDCVFMLAREVTVAEVNQVLEAAAGGALKGILGFEHRPLVSCDYTNDTRSGVVDGPSTMVIDGRMLKLLVWYDNEMGYVNRMGELAAMVARTWPIETV